MESKSPRRSAGFFDSLLWSISLEPKIDFFFRLVLGVAILVLQAAFEFVATSVDASEIADVSGLIA